MNTKETDENLALRIKSGQQDAFQLIFHRHYPKVCQVITRFIRDRSTTEDLAQEVFVRIWERRENLNIQTSFGAYLRRSAINEALSHIRRQKKNQEDDISELNLPAAIDGSQEKMEGEELRLKIKYIINLLPPRCRAVFLLSRQEELSYKEIAARLDISIKTVENQMVKALKIMREHLQSHLHWLLILVGFLD